MITKGCTPTFTFTFSDETLDLTQASHVYVTFCGKQKIEKSDADLTIGAKQVEVYLTQAETLALSDRVVSIQINWTYGDGSRSSSQIVKCQIHDNLIERVI